jgi:polyisoprenoid-binding protein YceI
MPRQGTLGRHCKPARADDLSQGGLDPGHSLKGLVPREPRWPTLGLAASPYPRPAAPRKKLMAHTPQDTLTGDCGLDVARSRLGFVARQAMAAKVRGQFDQFEGVGHLDLSDSSKSFAEATIDAASVNTGIEARDARLRSSDFLDVSKHPRIHFRSSLIVPVNGSRLRVVGDLTMRGVTRSVDLEFTYTGATTDPSGDRRVSFNGSGTINRRDWGLSWNASAETGGVLVSEMVTLEIEVCALRPWHGPELTPPLGERGEEEA